MVRKPKRVPQIFGDSGDDGDGPHAVPLDERGPRERVGLVWVRCGSEPDGISGDWHRWASRGGREILRRFGADWFSLLALRRWGRITVKMTSRRRRCCGEGFEVSAGQGACTSSKTLKIVSNEKEGR